jgi:Outer membrane protein
MRKAVMLAMGLLSLASNSAVASWLPDKAQVDGWLNELGADGQFDASKGIDWGVMPGPFYTPELGLGIGTAVVGMYRPDDSGPATQNSTLSLSGYFSTTGAFGLGVQNYTFLDNDRWRFFFDGKLDNTPTWYWGTGYHAGHDDKDKQKYTAQGVMARPEIMRQVADHSWVGLGWSFSTLHASGIEKRANDLLHNEAYGPSVLSSGASISLNVDTRDFVPNPSRGQALMLRYTHYDDAFGSEARFEEYQTRYNLYYSLSESSVLAWDLDGHFTQGEVPWNMLPLLGSDQRMRGYYEGRYRDRNAISGQVEYRRKLDWRNGIVLWGGGGTMGPRTSELLKGAWLPSVGVGYRFEFKPRMNVRLDYGIGRESSGFYFQVGEAF